MQQPTHTSNMKDSMAESDENIYKNQQRIA